MWQRIKRDQKLKKIAAEKAEERTEDVLDWDLDDGSIQSSDSNSLKESTPAHGLSHEFNMSARLSPILTSIVEVGCTTTDNLTDWSKTAFALQIDSADRAGALVDSLEQALEDSAKLRESTSSPREKCSISSSVDSYVKHRLSILKRSISLLSNNAEACYKSLNAMKSNSQYVKQCLELASDDVPSETRAEKSKIVEYEQELAANSSAVDDEHECLSVPAKGRAKEPNIEHSYGLQPRKKRKGSKFCC